MAEQIIPISICERKSEGDIETKENLAVINCGHTAFFSSKYRGSIAGSPAHCIFE